MNKIENLSEIISGSIIGSLIFLLIFTSVRAIYLQKLIVQNREILKMHNDLISGTADDVGNIIDILDHLTKIKECNK